MQKQRTLSALIKKKKQIERILSELKKKKTKRKNLQNVQKKKKTENNDAPQTDGKMCLACCDIIYNKKEAYQILKIISKSLVPKLFWESILILSRIVCNNKKCSICILINFCMCFCDEIEKQNIIFGIKNI